MLHKMGLIMLITLISTAVAAEVTDPKIHWCDGCSLDQEKAAVVALTGKTGTFNYYIGNLQARTIHKYRLVREWLMPPCSGHPDHSECQPEESTDEDSPHGKTMTSVNDKPVEGDIAEAFRNAVLFYYTEPVGWRKYYEVQIIDPSNPSSSVYKKFYRNGKFPPQDKPLGSIGPSQSMPVMDFPDPNATVYDVVVMGAKQDQFLDFFLSPGGQQFKVASSYLLRVLSFFSIFDADKLPANVILVKFADGGQITISLDSRTTRPHYVIDKTSARDSHGNFVPVRQEQLEGERSEFSFLGTGNVNDRPNMWRQLNGLGINMGQVPLQTFHYQCGPNRDGKYGVTCTVF